MLNVPAPIVMARSANDGPKLSLVRMNVCTLGSNVKVNPPADEPSGNVESRLTIAWLKSAAAAPSTNEGSSSTSGGWGCCA